MTKLLNTNYFHGEELSRYEKDNGLISYRTLFDCFNHILCNDIEKLICEECFYEPVSGCMYVESDNEESDDLEMKEIFQWYIIDGYGAELLEREGCSDPVFYIESLNLYVVGIDHYGTSWDYVFTNIRIEG